MSDRFYTPDPIAPGDIVLTGSEAHHLTAVRRFTPGDRIILFNGDGNEYPCEIVAVDRKQAVLNIVGVNAVSRELPFRLEIASAMPKGDRGDFLVEKLVELGVAQFTPLRTERTIVQPKETRLEKLHQAVIEASKQCGRNELMEIGPLTPWENFVVMHQSHMSRFILHPDGDPLRNKALAGNVLFAIGPEGGFTDKELTAAEAAGWKRMSLGSRILRVETAAIAAAAWAATQYP